MSEPTTFLRVQIALDYGCFVWVVEDEDEGFIGADWDDFAADIPAGLRDAFSAWFQRARPLDGSDSTYPAEAVNREGRALADELARALGQPVEYRA